MPKGKRISGAVGWRVQVPSEVVNPQALLDWRRPGLPKPDCLKVYLWRREVAQELGRYAGFRKSTPLPTDTQRKALLKKLRRQQNPLNPMEVDSTTRAVFYTGREACGAYWS